MESIIFNGIPASGKSTFYTERFFATHVHINMDMLKTRKREALILQACLAAKQPFVVDNTNILKNERAAYIEQARSVGFSMVGYYFQSRLQEALERNRQRIGKANIPEKGLIARCASYKFPTWTKGSINFSMC